MSESTGGRVWPCDRWMNDGTPCQAPASVFITDATGIKHSLCGYHARQWRNDVDRFKRVMDADTQGPSNE